MVRMFFSTDYSYRIHPEGSRCKPLLIVVMYLHRFYIMAKNLPLKLYILLISPSPSWWNWDNVCLHNCVIVTSKSVKHSNMNLQFYIRKSDWEVYEQKKINQQKKKKKKLNSCSCLAGKSSNAYIIYFPANHGHTTVILLFI